MSNINNTISKYIINNSRMIYELIVTLTRKGLLTTEEANQIISKEVKDGLQD